MSIKNFAIIPCRSGSRRILNKNICEVAGKPLVYWSMKAAEEAQCITKCFVSTDSPEYITIINGLIALYRFKNTYVIPRKLEYATAHSQLEEFIIPFLQNNECSNIALLQPTSPVRLPGTIDAAYKKFKEAKADSLLTIGKIDSFIWKDEGKKPNYDPNKRPRSQEYNSGFHFETGSIYLSKRKSFLEHCNRLCGKIELFETQPEENFEIDTELDLIICSAILKSIYINKEII